MATKIHSISTRLMALKDKPQSFVSFKNELLEVIKKVASNSIELDEATEKMDCLGSRLRAYKYDSLHYLGKIISSEDIPDGVKESFINYGEAYVSIIEKNAIFLAKSYGISSEQAIVLIQKELKVIEENSLFDVSEQANLSKELQEVMRENLRRNMDTIGKEIFQVYHSLAIQNIAKLAKETILQFGLEVQCHKELDRLAEILSPNEQKKD